MFRQKACCTSQTAFAKSPAGGTKGAFYRPELDALRFLAFLCVFVRHTTPIDPDRYARTRLTSAATLLAAISRAGAFGVDLFFVLSAYLITELLLREKQATGTLDVKAFYVRRILRIWPLYFVFLTFGFLWQWVDSTQRFTYGALVAYIFLAGNWACAFGNAPLSIVAQLWSVSIEEQFYLVWPQVVRRCRRRGLVLLSVLLMVIAGVSRGVLLRAGVRGWEPFWFNTLTRLDPLALGILLAACLNGKIPRLSRPMRLLLWCGCAGTWLTVALSGELGLSPGITLAGYPLVALGGVGMVVAMLGTEARPSSFLVRAGRISYGLYVVHIFAIRLVMLAFSGVPTRVLAFAAYWILALALSVAFAAVSYRWLESPFLKLKRRFSYMESSFVRSTVARGASADEVSAARG